MTFINDADEIWGCCEACDVVSSNAAQNGGAKKQGSEMCDSLLDYSVTRFLAMSLEFAAALTSEKPK